MTIIVTETGAYCDGDDSIDCLTHERIRGLNRYVSEEDGDPSPCNRTTQGAPLGPNNAYALDSWFL